MENNKLQTFKNEELKLNVRTIQNEDGSISINAEDTAIGFGWCRVEYKNNKEYKSIMWSRMNKFCEEIGFAHNCAKDDYIPESIFYMLGMKAKNDLAKKFQQWLAVDVIPSIRKHGIYATEKTIDKIISDPDFGIKLLTQLKEEKAARKIAEEKVTQFLDTTNTLSWNTVAKNLEIGRNTMLKELREMGILQTDVYSYNGEKHIGENHNIPYQRYMKYFVVKYVVKGDKRYPKTLVTAEGQEFLRKKLKR